MPRRAAPTLSFLSSRSLSRRLLHQSGTTQERNSVPNTEVEEILTKIAGTFSGSLIADDAVLVKKTHLVQKEARRGPFAQTCYVIDRKASASRTKRAYVVQPKRDHSVFTRFPQYSNCDVCKMAKTTRARCTCKMDTRFSCRVLDEKPKMHKKLKLRISLPPFRKTVRWNAIDTFATCATRWPMATQCMRKYVAKNPMACWSRSEPTAATSPDFRTSRQGCINLAQKCFPEYFMGSVLRAGEGWPTFTSNGSTTKKSHKKESCCFHVHTDFSNLRSSSTPMRGNSRQW